MKVNIALDGTVSVDIWPSDDDEKVLSVIRLIRKDNKPRKSLTQLQKPTAPVPIIRRSVGQAVLKAKQYELWSFLVDNDCENPGVHRSAVARHFGISEDTAGQRLRRLVGLGVVYPTQFQGYYRAVDSDSKQVTE